VNNIELDGLVTEPVRPVWVRIDKNQIDKFDEIINALILADNDTRRFELLKEAKSRLTLMRDLIEMHEEGCD
jgi:hypothetical protein